MTPLPPKADLTGIVKRQTVNAGSKSEHAALVIETEGRSFELRLKGGNPFEQNPALLPFLNMRVRIAGAQLMGNVAQVDNIADVTLLGPPGRPSRPAGPKP